MANIDDQFKQVMSTPVNKSIYKRGTPLFKPEDVDKTPFFLDKLVRALFVRKEVTKEYFTACYHKYARDTLGMPVEQRNSGKDNLLKAIQKGRMTQRTFQRTMKVLDYSIYDIEVDVYQANGSPEALRLTDLIHQNRNMDQEQKEKNHGDGRSE